MHPTEELELLAKWAWHIMGSSKDFFSVRSSHSPFPNGRPDVVDEQHEEVALAFRAYDALFRLYRSDAQGKARAELLVNNYVLRGEAAKRQQKKMKASSILQREQRRRQQETLLKEALDAYLCLRSTSC
jgi:hypothetical protein